MAERNTRTEATHRQRAAQAAVPMTSPPIGANGLPMVMVSGCASDLFPTVQFGNVLVGPVTITRWVEDEGLEAIIERSRETQQAAEAVCGSERRLIQWATDPSSRVLNPVTGDQMAPAATANGQAPAQPEAAPTTAEKTAEQAAPQEQAKQ